MTMSFTIDVHHHNLPDIFRRATNDAHSSVGGILPAPWSKESALSYMDDAGIDVAITSIRSLWPDFGAEACVLFPTLDMIKEGFEVYIPGDACGDVSVEAHERAMGRAVQAGAVPITSLQYVFELQQDWARTETCEGVMEILRAHSPYGIQVRFSKLALGEHASEAGGARAV
jgi:Isochorismatase family